MKFTKEQLVGKKIRYNGEEQWQQIVDACASVGIPVAEWKCCDHVDGKTVACISHDLHSHYSCKLLSSNRWVTGKYTLVEYGKLKPLVFPFEEEEGVEGMSSEDWDTHPPVGTECSLWTKRSGNKPEFDCKILGYQKDSYGDSVVWVEKLACPSHEDPFKTYLLSKVTFSKIKPKSWQGPLCDELEDEFRYFEYQEETDLFKIEGRIESGELVAFAKRIIELSEKSS